jgi:NAD+ kinase
VLFSSGLLCFNARMLPYFRSVAIVGKYMDDSALQNMRDDLTHLVQYLQSQELHVCVEEQTARFIRHEGFELASLENIGHKADLVVVMGGDGTMLSVARALRDSNVCLIGINRGRLGFLTDLQTDNMLGELEKILQGEYQLESRMLLQSAFSREQAQLWQSVAMNDVVIKSAFRLIELEVHVDGKFVSRQRADGLILATPTGTTAYGLSAGGPIMHPDLHAISIVPISPHTLSYRPITVPADSVIEVIIVNAADAQISFDGQGQHPLKEGDHIRIARGEQEIQLLHPKTYCYFDMLRNKLNWG